MEELIKRLKAMVESETESTSPDDFDDRDWGHQIGILISVNEAKIIIEQLTEQ